PRSLGEVSRLPRSLSYPARPWRIPSGRGRLKTISNELFANVALPLNAPRAPGVIEKLGVELMSQSSRGADHGVETVDRVSGARQHHEEAHSGERLAGEPLEVERARFRKARHAELRLVGMLVIVQMKDAVAAMLEPRFAQRGNGCHRVEIV